MKLLFVAVVVVGVVHGLYIDVGGKGTASGKFNYKGDQCKWSEKRDTGSKRSLNIQCGGSAPFSTKYVGDPHECSWYGKGNQVAYYECLVSALVKANFGKNSPSQVVCKKKKCGDVVFEKRSPHLRKLIMKTVELEEFDIESADTDGNGFDRIVY